MFMPYSYPALRDFFKSNDLKVCWQQRSPFNWCALKANGNADSDTTYCGFLFPFRCVTYGLGWYHGRCGSRRPAIETPLRKCLKKSFTKPCTNCPKTRLSETLIFACAYDSVEITRSTFNKVAVLTFFCYSAP